MAFRKLFWGFIFLFDFRFGRIDILPDIIAYVLFYQALSMLEDRNNYYSRAKKLTIPMIFLSALDIYSITIPINELSFDGISLFIFLTGIIATILSMLIVYNLCYGIAQDAKEITDYELEQSAINRWILYLVVNIGILLVVFIPITALFIILFIGSIISYLLLVGLMNTSSNKLD